KVGCPDCVGGPQRPTYFTPGKVGDDARRVKVRVVHGLVGHDDGAALRERFGVAGGLGCAVLLVHAAGVLRRDPPPAHRVRALQCGDVGLAPTLLDACGGDLERHLDVEHAHLVPRGGESVTDLGGGLLVGQHGVDHEVVTGL